MALDINIFKKRFYKLRENAKMSQFDFAKFLGIPTGSVGDYENGKKMPNSKALYKIAKKCNVSTDYLLGLSDARTIDNTVEEMQVKIQGMEIELDALRKVTANIKNIILSI